MHFKKEKNIKVLKSFKRLLWHKCSHVLLLANKLFFVQMEAIDVSAWDFFLVYYFFRLFFPSKSNSVGCVSFICFHNSLHFEEVGTPSSIEGLFVNLCNGLIPGSTWRNHVMYWAKPGLAAWKARPRLPPVLTFWFRPLHF